MRDAFVPPAQAVFAGFVSIAGRQGALIIIRLDGVDGEKGPVAAVDAAFYPDAVMAVFFKVDAHPAAGFTQLHCNDGFGDRMLHRIGGGDNAQVVADSLGVVRAGLDADYLAEQALLLQSR